MSSSTSRLQAVGCRSNTSTVPDAVLMMCPSAEPLETATDATSGWIGLRRKLRVCARRVACEVKEERLVWFRLCSSTIHFFARAVEEIGGVGFSRAWRRYRCPDPKPLSARRKFLPRDNAHARPHDGYIRSSNRNLASWDTRARRLDYPLSGKAPLSNRRRGISCMLENGRDGVIAFECLVKLVVTHVRMTLMNAQEQRRTRRGAHGCRAILTPGAECPPRPIDRAAA